MKILLSKNWIKDIEYNSKKDYFITDIAKFKEEILKKYISMNLKYDENLNSELENKLGKIFLTYKDIILKDNTFEKQIKLIIDIRQNSLEELILFASKHKLFENIFINLIFLEELGLTLSNIKDYDINVISNKVVKHKFSYWYENKYLDIKKIINSAYVLRDCKIDIYDYINKYFEVIEEFSSDLKYILNDDIYLNKQYVMINKPQEVNVNTQLYVNTNSLEYWIIIGLVIELSLNIFIEDKIKEQYYEVSKYFS